MHPKSGHIIHTILNQGTCRTHSEIEVGDGITESLSLHIGNYNAESVYFRTDDRDVITAIRDGAQKALDEFEARERWEADKADRLASAVTRVRLAKETVDIIAHETFEG